MVSGSEELKKCPPLPLQSCDSWMFVKENPDGKKMARENLQVQDQESFRLVSDFHLGTVV